MDLFAFPPVAAVLDLAHSGLIALTGLLSPVVGASAAAAAVVLVTLLVRAALIPVGISQARAEQARARLAPKVRELQTRFRTSPERLQRETLDLYRREKVSPFAGMLPVLLQAPLVGVLYAVFLHPTVAGHANSLLTHSLLGVPLSSSLAGAVGAAGVDPAVLLVTGGIVVAIAAVGELTRRLLRVPPPRADGSPVPTVPHGLLGVLQFITAVVAVFVPLAAGIYLLITVVWTLGQRLLLRRIYPLPIA